MATAFNLGGLLGNVFGAPSALNDLLTEEQRAAIQQQAGLAAAAALLQAGAPSTTRTSLGQALGSALVAGQTGAQKGTESALTQMLTRQKLDEAKRSRDLQTNIAKILAGGAEPAAGPVTAEEALAAPGMAAGPTVERAALIGQPRPQAAGPQMSQAERRAQQYRQIADVYAASGRSEEAKRFMEIAETLAPSRQEVIGDPIKTTTGYVQRTKTGGFIQLPKEYEPAAKPVGEPQLVTERATGRQVLAQRYDDGSYQTVEAFGPPRKLERVDTGGQIQFVDLNEVRPGSALAKTLAPQIVGSAEGGFFAVGGGGGRAAPAAGGAAPVAAPAAAPAAAGPGAAAAPRAAAVAPAAGPQPIIPGTGPKPPEAFMKAARQLNDLTGQIEDYKQTLKSSNWVFPKNIPIPFTDTGIALPTGSDTAAVSSRYNALLMGVKNLYELGALTGPDMAIIERQITNPASWSGLLTSRNAMNEQVKVLEDMLKRAKTNLETSYKQKLPEAARTEPAQTGGFAEGATATDRRGRPIVFRDGQWVYQ